MYMKSYANNSLILFDDLLELNDYTEKKYVKPLFVGTQYDFSLKNDYLVLSILVKQDKTKPVELNSTSIPYTFHIDGIKETDKGLLLGTLNNRRNRITNRILSISLKDNTIVVEMKPTTFKPFELGLIIDTRYDDRGFLTLSNYLSMTYR